LFIVLVEFQCGPKNARNILTFKGKFSRVLVSRFGLAVLTNGSIQSFDRAELETLKNKC
jgi:hypothetical protein